MGSDADGGTADADENVFASEDAGEFGRDGCWSAQAEIVRGAERLGGTGEAEFGGSGGDAAIEGAGSFRNYSTVPVQNLAHGVDGGGEERELERSPISKRRAPASYSSE